MPETLVCISRKSNVHSERRRRSVFYQRSSKRIYRKAESHVAVSRHRGLRQTAKLTDKTGRSARPYVLLMLKATTGARSLMIFPMADCSTGRSLVQAPIQPPDQNQTCRTAAGRPETPYWRRCCRSRNGCYVDADKHQKSNGRHSEGGRQGPAPAEQTKENFQRG